MKKSALKQLIKEVLESGYSKLKVGDKVILRKDVLARHARSVPAHMGYTTAQFDWRDTLDKLEGKVGTVSRISDNSKHVNVNFGNSTIGIDNTELEKVDSGEFSHSPQMRVRSDGPQFDETGEHITNESSLNVRQNKRMTTHSLNKTPNKSVSKLIPCKPVNKTLNEMSISREVNATDKAGGVTGYTSHIIKCRGCGKDCNTLRKDSVGREGVYCGKDCADKTIDELNDRNFDGVENFTEGLWDRLKADAAGSFKMGGQSLDAQVMNRFKSLKSKIVTDDNGEYLDFMKDIQKILGTKNDKESLVRLQGYPDIVGYLSRFNRVPPVIPTSPTSSPRTHAEPVRGAGTTPVKNVARPSATTKQVVPTKRPVVPVKNVAQRKSISDGSTIVIRKDDLPAFKRKNIKVGVNQVFRFKNNAWGKRIFASGKSKYVPLNTTNKSEKQIIAMLNKSAMGGRNDVKSTTATRSPVVTKKPVVGAKQSTATTKSPVVTKKPAVGTKQSTTKNSHSWVPNLEESVNGMTIDVDQVPLTPIDDDYVDCEVSFDYDRPYRATRVDPGQGWNIYVNTVTRKDNGVEIDFDKLDKENQTYIEDKCVEYMEADHRENSDDN